MNRKKRIVVEIARLRRVLGQVMARNQVEACIAELSATVVRGLRGSIPLHRGAALAGSMVDRTKATEMERTRAKRIAARIRRIS